MRKAQLHAPIVVPRSSRAHQDRRSPHTDLVKAPASTRLLSHHSDMTDERNTASGVLAAVLSVAVITLAIYGLRELVPVVSTGVVYMLAVLLVSGGWGLWLGLFTAVLSAAA